jgi:hypothetical protein
MLQRLADRLPRPRVPDPRRRVLTCRQHPRPVRAEDRIIDLIFHRQDLVKLPGALAQEAESDSPIGIRRGAQWL